MSSRSMGSGGFTDRSTRSKARKDSYQGNSVWWTLEGIPSAGTNMHEKLKEDQKKKEQKLPRTMLHPQARFRMTWDLIVLALLLYFMFSVPFRLCFLDTQVMDEADCNNIPDRESCNSRGVGCLYDDEDFTCHQRPPNPYFFWWDNVVDLFFAVDIILNFRTAYIILDEKAEQNLVTDSGMIAKRYLQTWFLFDFAGSIPLDFFLQLMVNANRGSEDTLLASLPRLLRFAKVFRLLKLVRAARIGSIIEKMDERLNIKPEVFKVLQFGFVFCIVAHVLSCILFGLGALGSNFVCLKPGLLCNEEMAQNKISMTWISKTRIVSRTLGDVSVEEAPVDTQYMMSIYWAITIMTTVGFGDIQPVTSYEVGTVIFSMLVGASTFSYVIGNMASLISRLDGHAGEFRQKMDQTTVFMHVNNVPKDLKLRIRKYYDYSFNHPQVDLNNTPLCDLSPALRLELLRFFQKNILSSVSLFKAIRQSDQDRFLSSLLECIVPIQRGPGDYIFYAGELGRDVHFIISGEVDLIDPETREIVASLRRGSYFGENALIPGEERRPFTVRSRSWCDMLVLSARDLKVVLQNFPDTASVIRLTARLRWSRLLCTIEAHKVVSRARARAALVTGQTLLQVMSKVKLESSQGFDVEGCEADMMDADVAEDRSMSRQEAELLGDLRATVLADEVGRQLAREVREVKGRPWDWSRDWVDGESILEEARKLVALHCGGVKAEKALIRRIQQDGQRSRGIGGWTEDEFGDFDGGMPGEGVPGESDEASPGIELEKTLLQAVRRLEVMEAETQLSLLSFQVSNLYSILQPLVPPPPQKMPSSVSYAPSSPPSSPVPRSSIVRAPSILRTPKGIGPGENTITRTCSDIELAKQRSMHRLPVFTAEELGEAEEKPGASETLEVTGGARGKAPGRDSTKATGDAETGGREEASLRLPGQPEPDSVGND